MFLLHHSVCLPDVKMMSLGGRGNAFVYGRPGGVSDSTESWLTGVNDIDKLWLSDVNDKAKSYNKFYFTDIAVSMTLLNIDTDRLSGVKDVATSWPSSVNGSHWVMAQWCI
jgi:hypothetical protein